MPDRMTLRDGTVAVWLANSYLVPADAPRWYSGPDDHANHEFLRSRGRGMMHYINNPNPYVGAWVPFGTMPLPLSSQPPPINPQTEEVW